MARVPLHDHHDANNGGPLPVRTSTIVAPASPGTGVVIPSPPSNPPPPVVTCVGDSFVRADSTAGLGTSSDGDLWVDVGSAPNEPHGIDSDHGYFELTSGGSYLGSATLNAILPPLPIVGSMNLTAPAAPTVTITSWNLTNAPNPPNAALTIGFAGGYHLGYEIDIFDGATSVAVYQNFTASGVSTAGDGSGLDNYNDSPSVTLTLGVTYTIRAIVPSAYGNPGYTNGLCNLRAGASPFPPGITSTQTPVSASGPNAYDTWFDIGKFTLGTGSGSAAPDAVTFGLTTTDSSGSGSIVLGYGETAGNLSLTITDSQGSTSTASVTAAATPFPNVQSFAVDSHGVSVTFNGQTVQALYSAGSPGPLLVPNTASMFTVNANSATSAAAATALFNNLTICNYAGTPVSPPPTSSSPSSIPTNIDPTGATDVSLALSAFLNGVAPGSTVTFPPTATYLAALKLHGLSNVTLEGQGCTIQAPSGGYTEDYSTIYLKSFPGTNSGITIHNFNLIGTSPTPGTFISGHEGQHGVLVDGASNTTIYGCTSAAMYGDFLEVNSGASGVWAHDNTVTNTGRNALSVIFGNNVQFGPNNSCPINGYMPFDIEPNTVSETCHDINIHDNTTGSWTNLYFATDGSATGAAIYNITVANNTSVGYSLATEVNPTGPGRESSVSFTGNSSNVADAGPVLQFTNVDTLICIHNTQSLSSGSLVSDTGCTNATITPNP